MCEEVYKHKDLVSEAVNIGFTHHCEKEIFTQKLFS